MKVVVKKDPRYRVSVPFLKKTATRILEELGAEKNTWLGLVVVGKRKAKQLNQQYRQMDYIPTVLSFPYHEKKKNYLLGEVVLCFPLVRKKAIEENQTLEDAFEELLYHGIGNLLR
ncbi:rRNA maturation RNase YbeY [bacterium]|nr:rRNA maturation RNase YbeY [bacterium]